MLYTATILYVSNLAGTGDETQVAAGNPVYLKVTDLDRNTDPTTVQTLTIRLNSGSGDVQETLTLTETGANTGIFTGTINTSLANPVLNDGTMQVSPDDWIRARYIDPLNASGTSYVPIYDIIYTVTGRPATGSIRFVTNATGNVDLTSILPGTTVFVELFDPDLNTNVTTVQTYSVTVTTANGDSETVLLTETGVNTNTFVGSIATNSSTVTTGNGTLNVVYGTTATVTYNDAQDVNGNPGVRTDTLTVRTPVTGTIRFVSDLTGAGDETTATGGENLFLRVDDGDLNLSADLRETVTITVQGLTTLDSQTITLTETGENTGIFTGWIGTTLATTAVAADGVLQVQQGENVRGTYVDALDANGLTNQNRTDTLQIVVVHYTGIVNFAADSAGNGDVSFIYVGDTVYLRVEDQDLNTSPNNTQSVSVTLTTTGGDSETRTLTETDKDTGIFVGSIPSNGLAVTTGNNLLNVAAGQTVTVTYLDAIDANNVSNQNRTDTLVVRAYVSGSIMFVANLAGNGDVTIVKPLQTVYVKVTDGDLNTDSSTLQSVSITLTTVAGDSEVITLEETGVNTGIFTGQIPTSQSAAATNSGTLNLSIGTTITATYNEAKDINGTAQVRTDTATVQANITGSIMFVADLAGAGDITAITVGDTVYLKVTDGDLNTNATTVQTVTVSLASSGSDLESVTLTETGVNTGVFTGSLPTTMGPAVSSNGALQLLEGQSVTATYVDAVDASNLTNQNRTDVVTVNTVNVTGTIKFVTALSGAGDMTSTIAGTTLYLRVDDADLDTNWSSAQNVNVTVVTPAGDSETVTLTETGAHTGIFTGQLPTALAFSATSADGTLQVREGETVTATYVDAIDAANQVNQNRTDTLLIIDLTYTGTVDFVTDLTGTTSAILLTPGDPVYLKVSDADLNTNPGTVQTVTVSLASAAGDLETVTLTETGANTGIFTGSRPSVEAAFTTGDGTIQVVAGENLTVTYVDAVDANGVTNQNRVDILPVAGGSTTGTIRFVTDGAATTDLMTAPVGRTLYLLVADLDQNTNDATLQTVQVTLTTTNGDSVTLTLTETGPATGQFTGQVATTGLALNPADSILQLVPGETVQATYTDAEDAAGNLNQPRRDTLLITAPFDLRPDRTGLAAPGTIVTYTHELQNYGPLANRFHFTITPGHADWTYLLYDTNDPAAQLPRDAGHGDDYYVDLGAAGSGTDRVTLVLRFFVPGQTPGNSSDLTSLTAAARDYGLGEPDTVVDVTTIQQGDLTLTKSVSPTGAVAPGATLTYTTGFTNRGAAPLTQVIILDQIPAHTTYTPGTLVANSTVVTFTLHFSTDGGLTWAATPTPPAAPVTTIRATLNEPLPPGGSGTVTFAVTVD